MGPNPTPTTRLVLPVAEVAARVPGAHIALVDPFLALDAVDDGVVAELRELFAELVPFPFVLGDPVGFPGGELYLPPQPVQTFRRIITTVRRAFPECIGPATSFGTVQPHLEVPSADAVPTPLSVHAREAVLLAGDDVLATFRFGTTAA